MPESSVPSVLDAAFLRGLAAGTGKCAPGDCLRAVAAAAEAALDSDAAAAALDAQLGALPSCQRDKFLIPTNGTLPQTDAAAVDPKQDCVYLVGNSLGLQPRRVREVVNEELDAWAKVGVNGHFTGKRQWMPIDENVTDGTAAVVGAQTAEVAVMNSLTVNLHLLMVSFYRPRGKRNLILYESDAFGSDYFAFESQARLHGLDPAEVLRPVRPREGEELLRTEDIVKAIEEAGDRLCVACLGTVQYYTGQYFDVPAVTAAAHAAGAYALWDCAHAAGNVDLRLHDWGVDGACWCSYKYLNSGPGGIGGFFVHEKHHGKQLPILAGWWGQKQDTRFDMSHKWMPEDGASAWRLSNPPVLQTVSLMASLEAFGQTSMAELRGRSLLLTGYLELLLQDSLGEELRILTPTDPAARGCQLSLKFDTSARCDAVFAGLEKRGVVVDHRKPNVIRVAPAPLYNTFGDVLRFVRTLRQVTEEIDHAPAKRQRVAE